MYQQCKYNVDIIKRQVEPGTFLPEMDGPFSTLLLVENNAAFTIAVRDKIASTIKSPGDLINAASIEDALVSIGRYGVRDGQWVVSSVQGKLPNTDIVLTHIHTTTAYATRPPKVARVLVVYADFYIDICVVFVPAERPLKKRRKVFN